MMHIERLTKPSWFGNIQRAIIYTIYFLWSANSTYYETMSITIDYDQICHNTNWFYDTYNGNIIIMNSTIDKLIWPHIT